MVLTRGGGIGSQRNPYMWAGDQCRTFPKLKDQLIGVLTSGMSGVPFMTVDLAGYAYANACLKPAGTFRGEAVFRKSDKKMTPETEAAVFRRGLEFATFLTCLQSHGSVMNAYEFDEQTRRHYCKYVDIHRALEPYMSHLNRLAAERGTPPLRPLAFAFPEDPRNWNRTDAFMLGDALLAIPVLGTSEAHEPILPPGDWKRIEGVDFPLYLNGGADEASAVARALANCGLKLSVHP